MAKKKKDKEIKEEKPEKPAWKDEMSQTCTGHMLYRVMIRADNPYDSAFGFRDHIITRDWADAGRMLLKNEGLDRKCADFRTMKKSEGMPFVFRDTGLFNYDEAMSFAFWCEANIGGEFKDSHVTPKVEAAIQRIRVGYSVDLKRENALHQLPKDLALQSFMEEIEERRGE